MGEKMIYYRSSFRIIRKKNENEKRVGADGFRRETEMKTDYKIWYLRKKTGKTEHFENIIEI